MLHFILALVFLWSPGSHAATGNGPGLMARVRAAETHLKNTSSKKARIQAFQTFLREIDHENESIKNMPPADTAERAYQLALMSLSDAAHEINLADLSTDGCATSRARILMSFAPRQDPPTYLPDEVKRVLAMLEALCS